MFAVNQIIKFAVPMTEAEQGERFEAVELRGPRVLVRLCDSGFSAGLEPTAVYLTSDMTDANDKDV